MKYLTTLLTLAGFATAADPPEAAAPMDRPHRGTFSLYWENDLFAKTDNQYTNGARLSWTSPSLRRFGDDTNLGRLAGWFDDKPWIGDPGFERNVALTLGQTMYTPSDTTRSDLIENDRPYAGWLYVGLGLIWKNEDEKNTLIIDVGVVGPWSFAEQTQRLVHEARGNPFPRGWGNQLDNELGISLAYERMWRLRDRKDEQGWDWDFLPYAGATLGNVAINARGGAEARFGFNLPDDFGTAAIGPASTTPAPVEAPITAKRWHNNFGMHVFVRAEGRAVARDIFLDGNTFGSSHSVDKEPFVGDLAAGLSVNWRNTKLTYCYIARSREFEEQGQNQVFGSVTLNWTF